MSVFEPPPTWADPTVVDEQTGKARFNPIWLKWFIDFTAVINASGGGSGGIVHNDTSGLQGGTANQYYHLSAAAAALVTAYLHNALNELQGGGAGEYYHLTAAQYTGTSWASWTPTRTGWTDVGAPTVTARYCTLFRTTFFQIKIIPATTTATVAGTSYVSLPVAQSGSALAGEGSMMNITTLVAVGTCAMDMTNGRIYVPTQGATANTLTIAGFYET